MKNKAHLSLDGNAPTCKSGFSWCQQLLLRINIITVGDARNILNEEKIIKTREGKLPKEFYPANLDNLFVDQFVTWDEAHRKFIPGSDDGYVRTPYKDNIMKIPCDYNGKLDVLNGEYSREKVTLTPITDGVEQPQEGRRLLMLL